MPEFIIAPEHDGKRLDSCITDCLGGFSRARVQKLIGGGNVTLDGKIVERTGKNKKVKQGQKVSINDIPVIEISLEPQNIPLNIVYEDDYLVVVNKDKGMVVHPAVGNYDHTLVNALLHHCRGSLSGIGGYARPGIVHRLDKDTSGLLVAAKNDTAHIGLSAQIAKRNFFRRYEAVVTGTIKPDTGTIEKPIGRSRTDRKKMAVTQYNAKTAVTHFRVLERFPGFTHIELKLVTGRTHQIRVHMAHIGHPVAGDMVYGAKKQTAIFVDGGQCLHSKEIRFIHPVTGENMLFDSELPEYFTQALASVNV